MGCHYQSDTAVINLPWPPTVNNYYTIARGRKILSKRGRAYKKEAVILMYRQNVPKGREGIYSLMIYVRPPDNRKRDLDNLLKPLLDSLVDYGALPDDSMIDDLRIQRFNTIKGGQVSLSLSCE